MIKGLFCHYLPIYKDINGVYCSTTLTDAFFDRYFCAVDELIVATRVYQIDKTYIDAHQEKISLDNIRIVEFSNLSSLRGILVDLKKAREKIENLVKETDLIFIRGGVIALLGVDAAKKLNKPYLMECAGCAWDEYWNYNFVGKIMAPYMEYREKKDTRDASYVIYVTEKWLQNRYPTNGISTYASNVMLNSFNDEVLQKRISRLNCFDKKKLRIGTTGGVGNKAKGQQFVIKAMARLRNKYDIVYELVGSGDNSYLKKIAKKNNLEDKVVFKGQLTHEEILGWLDSLDLYIQPSMQEGLPRSLIEAMSRACPAVGSSTAGIPELLEKKCVFNRGSLTDLVKAIDSIIKDNLYRIAERNFKKSKEYRVDLLNERRNQIYAEYLKSVKDKYEGCLH